MTENMSLPGGPDFIYRDGALYCEDVALADIAETVGTPFYAYSTAAIERQYRRFTEAFAGRSAMLCYAVKANDNVAVLRTLARLGAGADIVSEGELRRALAAGVAPNRIIFSGVGKSAAEMEFALHSGVHQINVESEPELVALSAVAHRLGKVATIAIRVNPDVDARTHAKISTGKSENKFGIDLAHAAGAFRRAMQLPGIRPVGVAVHIGSQITQLDPFEQAFAKVVALFRELRAEGVPLRRLDLGGGLGIRYRNEAPPAVEDYAEMIARLSAGLEVDLAFEQGRWIVGNAGALVSRVLYVKEGVTRRFVVIDAGMNDLIRPTLYDAYHEIAPLRSPAAGSAHLAADIVGPICETGDYLARGRMLPSLAADDLIAMMSAGAYGAVMSSSYNSRLLVPEVLVRGEEYAVIRRRPTYEELLAQEKLPPWL